MMTEIKNILVSILLFCVSPLAGQDSTKTFCFPHNTGDIWEYRFSEFGDPISWYDTVQSFTIHTFKDSNGIIHMTQYSRQINPTKPPYVLPDTTKYLIDTVSGYVYGGRERPLSTITYKLNGNKSEMWYDTSQRIAVKVVDKWQGVIFGISTTFMQMAYYKYYKIEDTLSWLITGIDIIADGFGLVYAGGVEATSQEIKVIGAILNGKLYGDTTLLSVKHIKEYYPSTIRLYQNYPNPFNPSTTISFELLMRSNISLTICDVLGKEIYTLIDNEAFDTGKHEIVWKGLCQNGIMASSGLYFYRLIANQQTLTRSLILLK